MDKKMDDNTPRNNSTISQEERLMRAGDFVAWRWRVGGRDAGRSRLHLVDEDARLKGLSWAMCGALYDGHPRSGTGVTSVVFGEAALEVGVEECDECFRGLWRRGPRQSESLPHGAYRPTAYALRLHVPRAIRPAATANAASAPAVGRVAP